MLLYSVTTMYRRSVPARFHIPRNRFSNNRSSWAAPFGSGLRSRPYVNVSNKSSLSKLAWIFLRSFRMHCCSLIRSCSSGVGALLPDGGVLFPYRPEKMFSTSRSPLMLHTFWIYIFTWKPPKSNSLIKP